MCVYVHLVHEPSCVCVCVFFSLWGDLGTGKCYDASVVFAAGSKDMCECKEVCGGGRGRWVVEGGEVGCRGRGCGL